MPAKRKLTRQQEKAIFAKRKKGISKFKRAVKIGSAAVTGTLFGGITTAGHSLEYSAKRKEGAVKAGARAAVSTLVGGYFPFAGGYLEVKDVTKPKKKHFTFSQKVKMIGTGIAFGTGTGLVGVGGYIGYKTGAYKILGKLYKQKRHMGKAHQYKRFIEKSIAVIKGGIRPPSKLLSGKISKSKKMVGWQHGKEYSLATKDIKSALRKGRMEQRKARIYAKSADVIIRGLPSILEKMKGTTMVVALSSMVGQTVGMGWQYGKELKKKKK